MRITVDVSDGRLRGSGLLIDWAAIDAGPAGTWQAGPAGEVSVPRVPAAPPPDRGRPSPGGACQPVAVPRQPAAALLPREPSRRGQMQSGVMPPFLTSLFY